VRLKALREESQRDPRNSSSILYDRWWSNKQKNWTSEDWVGRTTWSPSTA